MKFLNLKLILISSLVFLQACNSSSNDNETVPTRSTDTIYEVAASNEDFSTLVVALDAAGLDTVLSDPEASFTVFAPTNDAFALLGQEKIDELLNDIPELSSILTYHVLAGEVDSGAAIASAGQTVPTVNGESVGLSLDGSMLLVNTVTVTAVDILTANGVIHVIDAVLLPPVKPETEPTLNIVETAVADGRFTTLVTALGAADLVDALQGDGPFTVFAPTDDAFAMIDSDTLTALLADIDALQSVLLQHVVSGQVDAVTAYSLNGQSATTLSTAMIPVTIDAAADSLMFGGANVIIKDIYTTNGIIHVIDAVVVGDLELPMAPAPMSIVDVAVANGNFTTLVAALQATGLDTVLSDLDAQYTVFAPTDEAFALLGQETIDSLLADPDALANILLYHVISDATILAEQAVAVAGSDDNEVGMANDEMATLTLLDGALYINMSKVIAPDVMADNGVIHVVDQVVLPPAM